MKIINLRDVKKTGHATVENWCKHEDNVYIGKYSPLIRGSVKNIWDITMFSDLPAEERDRAYIQRIENSRSLMTKLRDLRDKTLGCWCKPGSCHGDLLVELYEKHFGPLPTE